MFLILRRNDRDMINNVYWHSYKMPFFLVRFSCNEFSQHIFDNTQMPNFMKISLVGA